jgi:hypothetical protein
MRKRQCFEELPQEQHLPSVLKSVAGPYFQHLASNGMAAKSTSASSPSPPHSPTYAPAYRPTSPVPKESFTHQYLPTSACLLPHRPSDRHPSVYDFRPEYHQTLVRIECDDPSLTHLFLKPVLNPLFGHPEYEYSDQAVLSGMELRTLAGALSANTRICSMDLSCLALGHQAVALMQGIVRMTSLTELDLRDNGLSAGDISHIFQCAAAAGMTQLRELRICEEAQFMPSVPVGSVITCSEWSHLKLPQLSSRCDLSALRSSTALLHLVIGSMVTDHACASIATSKFVTFRTLSPTLTIRPTLSPPLLVSRPQLQRLLATGGCSLFLVRSLVSSHVSPNFLRSRTAIPQFIGSFSR